MCEGQVRGGTGMKMALTASMPMMPPAEAGGKGVTGASGERCGSVRNIKVAPGGAPHPPPHHCSSHTPPPPSFALGARSSPLLQPLLWNRPYTHPGRVRWSGSLTAACLHHCQSHSLPTHLSPLPFRTHLLCNPNCPLTHPDSVQGEMPDSNMPFPIPPLPFHLPSFPGPPPFHHRPFTHPG